jgi:RNA polymerase sigma-70 factor (ECF subfamily)
MTKLQTGDETAFEEIYDLTKGGLFSFVASMCKNHHTAEDLMQNTYVVLRTKIDAYRPGSNALAWIYTVARNLTINDINKRKREVYHDFDDSSSSVGGEYTLDDKVASPLFDTMKRVLNETEEKIVTLHVVAGFKHREIADILDMPLGTVLWSYRNALSKMKKQLQKEGDDEA